MTEEFKTVMEVEGAAEGEIIKSRLNSFGIPCLLKFESAGRLFGITMDGLGKIKIMVNPQDYDRALEVLDQDKPDTA